MKRAIELALRAVLGAVFVVAGVVKLRDPNAFAIEIANYHLGEALAPWLAVALPPIEVGVGVAVLVGPLAWRRAAAACAVVLLGVFTFAVATTVARGIDVTCGCFGASSGRVDGLTVVRDVALLACAALLFTRTRGRH